MGAVEEKIMLEYYNFVLFEKGLITKRERNIMALKIASRFNRQKRVSR